MINGPLHCKNLPVVVLIRFHTCVMTLPPSTHCVPRPQSRSQFRLQWSSNYPIHASTPAAPVRREQDASTRRVPNAAEQDTTVFFGCVQSVSNTTTPSECAWRQDVGPHIHTRRMEAWETLLKAATTWCLTKKQSLTSRPSTPSSPRPSRGPRCRVCPNDVRGVQGLKSTPCSQMAGSAVTSSTGCV